MDTVELVRVHRVPPGEMNVPAQEFARGSLQRADRRTWLHQARRWSARGVVPIVLATAMLAAGASTASAVIVHLANGRTLSYQPLRGASAVMPYDAFFHDLDYNGGPLMPSNTNYAVYWRPSGGPEYPSDYQPGLNQYLTDLAHDSGGHENTDSVSTQYNDAAGDFASYSSRFGGALIDTDAYPANGCKQATICLTDAQLRSELSKFVKAQGLPTDLVHEYILLTPPGVEDCFEANGLECSAGSKKPTYCAYHGNVAVTGGELVYANDPYVSGNFLCEDGNHPNGTTSDGALEGGLSHEHNESITDPEPNNAWTDFGGSVGEIGDKCRTGVETTEFGTPLGKAPNGAKYNQVINGHLYWYQQEWSNQTHQCLQRLAFSGAEPTATFTSKLVTGNEVSFDASGSTAPGGVSRYNWQFNDGKGGSPTTPVETTGPTVSHLFATAGPYVVALTVFASDGTSIGTARTIESGNVVSVPTVVTKAASSISQTSATLNATVNPNGRTVSECKLEYGTSSAYGSSAPCTPAPGSGTSPVAVSASPTGLTANTTYHFRVTATNLGGTSNGADETLRTLPNPPTVQTKAASSVTRSSGTLNATVNPNGGEVGICKFEYGTSTAYGQSAPCTPAPGSGESPVAVSASVAGLSPNTTYHFRISATNAGGTSNGSDETLKTLVATPPTVLSAAASAISQTAATLNATVNPNGGEVSECHFEYGTTIAYGSSAPCSSLPGSGTTPVAVSASIAGLSNKTTYHFRISATNVGGTSSGSDETFTAASVHLYKNGLIGAEGKPLSTIAWGTLKLTNATLGEVECHSVSGGYLENPAGGGSAVGKLQALVPYECVSESCKALGGTKIEVSAETLPWSTEVIETAQGTFRMRTGNRIKAAGAQLLRINCVGVRNSLFFAEDAPRLLNTGLTIGAAPEEEEFDQPGSGELESEALGGLKFSGKIKVEGYGAEQLIEVRNP